VPRPGAGAYGRAVSRGRHGPHCLLVPGQSRPDGNAEQSIGVPRPSARWRRAEYPGAARSWAGHLRSSVLPSRRRSERTGRPSRSVEAADPVTGLVPVSEASPVTATFVAKLDTISPLTSFGGSPICAVRAPRADGVDPRSDPGSTSGMAIEHVGYVRVYRSPNCEVRGGDYMLLSIAVGATQVSVSIGKKIRLLIPAFSVGPPEPKRSSRNPKRPEKKGAPEETPPRWKFGASCYTELIALEAVQVSDATSEAFRRKDPAARGAVLKLAEGRRKEFTAALDIAASSIGLYVHPYLVSDRLADYAVAFRGGSTTIALSDTVRMRTVRPFKMHVRDAPRVQRRVRVSNDRAQKAALVAPWLLRAWGAADDPITEFTSLFVPLEMVLERKAGDRTWNRRVRALKNLVQRYGDRRRGELSDFLAQQVQRPPLRTRFAVHAGRARLRGWRGDLAAFRRFNIVRNDLLHRGEQDPLANAVVGEREVLSLADVVHRYVGRELYGVAPRRRRARTGGPRRRRDDRERS
jgi:hypothetical protein